MAIDAAARWRLMAYAPAATADFLRAAARGLAAGFRSRGSFRSFRSLRFLLALLFLAALGSFLSFVSFVAFGSFVSLALRREGLAGSDAVSTGSGSTSTIACCSVSRTT